MSKESKLKQTQVITRISFLVDGKREAVMASDKGTFRVPVTFSLNGRLKTEYRDLTAKEIIEHPVISHADPVLTLKDGSKVRVFDGGDSSYLPAMSQGIVEKHDKVENLRRKFIKNKEKLKTKLTKQDQSGKMRKTNNDTDEYDSPFFDWDGYDYD